MSAQPSRRVSKWRILLIFVLVLGTSAYAAARHPWVRAQIDRELAAAIRRELGLDATIGPVHLALPLRLVADSIELRHPQQGLLVRAERLEVTPSLLAVARGQLELRRVVIEGARVRLKVVDGRVVNLPELRTKPTTTRKKGAAKPMKLPLEELIVRDAGLEIDAAPRLTGSLSDVLIHVRIEHGSEIRLSFRAGAGELVHEHGSESVRSLGVVAQLADGKLALEHLALRSSLLTAHVSKATLDWPLKKDSSYLARVAVEADLTKVAALPLGAKLPHISGKLTLRGKIAGQGEHFRWRGEVLGNPVLNGFGFGDLELKVLANDQEVILLPGSLGRIVQDGGVVDLEGRLGLGPSLPVNVKVDFKTLDFHKLMAQLGVTQNCLVNWVLRGGFKLGGTIQPLAITGPIAVDHVSFKALTQGWTDPLSKEVIGTPAGRIAGRVVVRPDALRFENLHAHLPHSDMQVTVHVGFDDKIGLTARSTTFDLRDATTLMGMSIGGHGGFSLDLGGTYSNTTLTGTLDLQDFELHGYRVGHMKTRAVLEKGGLAVRFLDTEVQKPDSSYRIEDMFLDFSEQFSIEAKGQLHRLSLRDFYHTFVLENDPDFQPYQGHVRGGVQARYTLGFPGDKRGGTLTVATDLDVLDAEVYGVAFKGGRLEGRWIWHDIDAGTRGARLELAEFHLDKGRGSVVAHGTMDLGGKLALTVFAEELELGEVRPIREQGLELSGEVGAVGTVRGTLWTPELALDVQTVGLQILRRNLGDGDLKVFVTHRDDPWVQKALGTLGPNEPCKAARAAVARASWEGATSAEGSLPPRALVVCGPAFEKRMRMDLAMGLASGLPVRGRVEFERLSPSLIWPRKRSSDPALSGNLEGAIELRNGNLQTPDSLVGSIELAKLSIGQDQVSIANSGPVRIALTGHGLDVERAHFVGTGTELDVSGGASFAEGLAINVKGTLDLQVLPALVPSLTGATGILQVGVKLAGNPADPSVFGRASLTHGTLQIPGTGQQLEKLDARLSFSERELLLEDLGAELAGGRVNAHGSATLEGQKLGRYELFIGARDINYSPMSGAELAIAADTKLAQVPGQRLPELTGTVRILRLRYKRPFSLGITERLTGLSQAKRTTHESYDPNKDHIAFDLRVVDEAPLRVDNNLLKAELRIEDSEIPFRVVGTDQRIGVLGILEVRQGSLLFRNTEFKLDEGSITFLDEHRVRPRLDIHARTEFRRQADTTGARWAISLHAVGETDDLKLETSSDPALAQEDIALLLTVGLTRAEAERLGTQQVAQGAALEALATVTGVDKEVRKALPVIDDFTVTSAYSARTNRTEPQVVVGKRISDKVRATATTGVTPDSNIKAGVEWRLDNETSVVAGYDNVQTTGSSQLGNVGLDLRWRLEFD